MDQTPVLVSTCLLGARCRYDGGHQRRDEIVKMSHEARVIPVCGEQMGGLTTPRPPAERIENKVITVDGHDVTKEFLRGAEDILALAKELGVKKAYLKSRSPMCGSGQIYDGSFSGKLINGNGVLSEMLMKAGIEVIAVD